MVFQDLGLFPPPPSVPLELETADLDSALKTTFPLCKKKKEFHRSPHTLVYREDRGDVSGLISSITGHRDHFTDYNNRLHA